MLVPLERPSRDASFALNRKDEVIDKVWTANNLSQSGKKIDELVMESLTAMRKYKDNQSYAAKMLNNEANNSDYSAEERIVFKKKAQGHLDFAEEADVLYKKVKAALSEFFAHQSKILDAYVKVK